MLTRHNPLNKLEFMYRLQSPYNHSCMIYQFNFFCETDLCLIQKCNFPSFVYLFSIPSTQFGNFASYFVYISTIYIYTIECTLYIVNIGSLISMLMNYVGFCLRHILFFSSFTIQYNSRNNKKNSPSFFVYNNNKCYLLICDTFIVSARTHTPYST